MSEIGIGSGEIAVGRGGHPAAERCIVSIPPLRLCGKLDVLGKCVVSVGRSDGIEGIFHLDIGRAARTHEPATI